MWWKLLRNRWLTHSLMAIFVTGIGYSMLIDMGKSPLTAAAYTVGAWIVACVTVYLRGYRRTSP